MCGSKNKRVSKKSEEDSRYLKVEAEILLWPEGL